MKKRGDRNLTELYDRTQKIPRSEIEGLNCKEEIGDMGEPGVKEEKASPSRKRKNSESGVCNVCCAPCSNCFHRMRVQTEVSFVDNCSEASSRASFCEHENAHDSSKCKNPKNMRGDSEIKQEGQGENSKFKNPKNVRGDSESKQEGQGENSKLQKNTKNVRGESEIKQEGQGENSKLKNPKNVKGEREIKQEGQGDNSSCVTKDSKEKCDVVSSRDESEKEIRVLGKSLKIDEKLVGKSGNSDKIDDEIRVSDGNLEVDEKPCEKVGDAIISSQDKIRVSDKSLKVDEKKLEIEGSSGAKERFEEMKKDQKQDQAIVETKVVDSDGLVDVKVCDICGDSGREELLATCSRCIDGAEHTYCMRVKMEKLPEGEWLCEECQLTEKLKKEIENKNKIKSTRLITPRSTPRSEKEINKNNLINSKNPFKRLRVSIDSSDASVPASPKNPFKEPIMSPRKITGNLLRNNSVKNYEKMKLEKFSPESSQTVKGSSANASNNNINTNINGQTVKGSNTNTNTNNNNINTNINSQTVKGSNANTSNNNIATNINSNVNSNNFSRSYSLSNMVSPKGVDKAKSEILSPKVTLTKHMSFKNLSTKSKVKLLTESKPKPTGLSISKPIKEEKRFKRLVKSSSLKEGSFESAKEKFKQREEKEKEKEMEKEKDKEKDKEKEKEKEKEKKLVESKDSFKGEKNRTANLVQKTGTVVKKLEPKGDGIGNKKPEFGTSSSIIKGTAFEDKKQDLPIEKKKLAFKPSESRSPRSIQILTENPKKLSKWKPAVKTVISKGKTEGKTVISDKSEGQVSKSRVSGSLTPKDRKFPSTNTEETPKSRVLETNAVPKAKKEPLLRDQNAISVNLEGPSKSRDQNAISNSGVLIEKVPKDMLSRSSSLEIPADLNVISSNLRDLDAKMASTVMPEQNFVWQGNFEIFRNGKPTETYEGIQAHFSNCVSQRVVQISSKLSPNLRLEVVSCASSWPAQFKESKPSEDHIALFFFAKDVQSYDNSYRRLLQNILGEDLALKGNIHGAELLIFPSNKLPQPSQKWNSLFFLWGVFRAKKQESLTKPSLNSPKREFLTKSSLYSPKLISYGPEPSSSKIFPMKVNKNEKLNVELLPTENNSPKSAAQELTVTSQSANTSQNNLNKEKNRGDFLMENNPSSLISCPISNQVIDENIVRASNKRAHSSEGKEELNAKRKCGHTDGHTESSSFLNKLTSPKIPRIEIDLEKPAENEEDLSIIELNKVPNLNLGLGDENENGNPSFEPVPLPLFPPVREKQEEKDEALSLSLSLKVGPSVSHLERENENKNENDNKNKSVVKVQEFLPEKPGVKKGFRLFGGNIEL